MKRAMLAILIVCVVPLTASAEVTVKYSQPNYNKYHQPTFPIWLRPATVPGSSDTNMTPSCQAVKPI